MTKISIKGRRSANQCGLAIACALISYMSTTVNVNAAVLVNAHRGASIVAPENTIASINAAAGIADLTEFDVRLSSDGTLVLMHDSTITRTTESSGSLESKSLAQLQALDAGSWFSSSFVGEKIPTMTDAVNAAFANNLIPLIERKAGGALNYHNEFTAQGIDPNDFRLIAFDWNFLSEMDALDTSYDLGALGSGTMTLSVINNALAKGADFLNWRASDINQAAVDLVHANGMDLHVWTVNDASRMQELIDFGVDGIATDDPALLSSLTCVPEPSSIALLSFGAFSLMLRRKRC